MNFNPFEEELKEIDFCFNCSNIVVVSGIEQDFFRRYAKNLFIYQIKSLVNDQFLYRMTNLTLSNFVNNELVDEYDFPIGSCFCGECIEKLREFIKYDDNQDVMYVVLPTYIDVNELLMN